MIKKQISCPTCKEIISVKGKPHEKRIIICPSCNTKGFFKFEEENQNSSNDFKSIVKILFLFLVISLLIIVTIFIFQTNDMILVFTALILIPIIIFFKVDLRMLFFYAIILLVLSAIGLAFYKDTFIANQIAINSYWLIVVGVSCYFINYLRKYWKIINQKSFL